MVILLVGGQKVPFHVHMDILCRSSSFFKSAFMGSGDFKETSERSMALPEDDAQAFDNILHWLYSGKFLNTTSSTFKESREQAQEVYLQLAVLYVTADKYDIHGLQNHIMSYICELYRDDWPVAPGPSVIDYIYKTSSQSSPFRQVLVQWYVWSVDLSCYARPSTPQWLSQRLEFAADMVIEFALRASGGKNPWETSYERFLVNAGDRAEKLASNDVSNHLSSSNDSSESESSSTA